MLGPVSRLAPFMHRFGRIRVGDEPMETLPIQFAVPAGPSQLDGVLLGASPAVGNAFAAKLGQALGGNFTWGEAMPSTFPDLPTPAKTGGDVQSNLITTAGTLLNDLISNLIDPAPVPQINSEPPEPAWRRMLPPSKCPRMYPAILFPASLVFQTPAISTRQNHLDDLLNSAAEHRPLLPKFQVTLCN